MIRDAFAWLLSTDPLVPHGFCLMWRPDLVWSHVIADAIVALSYFTIPVFLVILVRRRRDLHFSWAFYAFGAFILLCGTTHVMNIVAFWIPLYGLEAVIKAATALASVATAIAVWPLLPKILALPSHADLEQANAALESRVAERTTELQGANAQLRVLLREVHHRVKNNLQVIASMLRLKQREIEDAAVREALGESIARVHAISLVHETLYAGERFAALNVGVYLRGLVESIRRADPRADDMAIDVESDATTLDVEQSVPLGLIANEVIGNALKHAFAPGQRGRIAVRLASSGSQVRLEIADSGGNGRPRGESRGIGLQIVQALARQLDGTANFETGADGARFVLEFKRPAPSPAHTSKADDAEPIGDFAPSPA